MSALCTLLSEIQVLPVRTTFRFNKQLSSVYITIKQHCIYLALLSIVFCPGRTIPQFNKDPFPVNKLRVQFLQCLTFREALFIKPLQLFLQNVSNINRYVIIRGHFALEANGFWKNFKHFNNDFPPSCSHVHNVMSYQGYFFPRCSSAQTPVGAAASPPTSAVVKVIF